jgi:hypothetical protein
MVVTTAVKADTLETSFVGRVVVTVVDNRDAVSERREVTTRAEHASVDIAATLHTTCRVIYELGAAGRHAAK